MQITVTAGFDANSKWLPAESDNKPWLAAESGTCFAGVGLLTAGLTLS